MNVASLMQWVMNGRASTPGHSAWGLDSNDEAIEEAGAEVSDRIQEIAERANVPEGFVRQLVAVDALPGEEGELELAGAVRRVRLLRSWTAAGLSVETILTLINRGALSLAFLDAPVMALPERLDRSYEQLAADHGVTDELPTGAPSIARIRLSGAQ